MTEHDNLQLRAAIDDRLAHADNATLESDREIVMRPRDKGLSDAEEIALTFMVLQARARNLIDRRAATLDDFKKWL